MRFPFNLRQSKPLEEAAVADLYSRPPSFTDLLPWTTYEAASGSFVLDDGLSRGVAFEIVPVGTEAVDQTFLTDVRNALRVALVDSIPEDQQNPWVIQFYLQDDYDLSRFKQSVSKYGASSSYSRVFDELFDAHLERISERSGAFVDEKVTGGVWRGKIRRVRGTLYQRLPTPAFRLLEDQERHLLDVFKRFQAALAVAGIHCERLDLLGFREWLVPWFNPKPSICEEDPRILLDLTSDQLADPPLEYDVGQDLLVSSPSSETVHGVWWLDGLPHQALTIQGIRRTPRIGHFSAEIRQGDRLFTLFDAMPEGTICALTITVQSQIDGGAHLARIKKAAIGDSAEAEMTREQLGVVERELAKGDKLYSAQLAFYLRGRSLDDLKDRRNALSVTLLANGLQPLAYEHEKLALDSYLRNLPMAYDPQLDVKVRRSRLMLARDVANLVPAYGRSRGQGKPGFVFFNRGAEPLCFDPLATEERKKNAHLLVLGPSGAGKSAMLVYLLQQAMARHRPRLFIVETGGSFELLGEHFKAHGLSVNQVRLQPDSDVRLPPFSHAARLTETQDDISRDFLGEMEIVARIMITGGDAREQERLTRADRTVIRQAILMAGKRAKESETEVLTEHVVQSLRTIAEEDNRSTDRYARISEMADAMALFTSGVAGHFFNRPGTAWPDVDVTIFELGLLAREGYEDQLTVAYLSLMAHIHDLVEMQQDETRQTLVVTDEGHVILTHPLLSNYVVKITKMWRKFGAWFWIATQNLADFPDQSKRMLNMIEWWLCLSMPKDEIDQLARFRKLTDGQRALLMSAHKEPGKYVEGVVLSDAFDSLFRNVPPALSLALAMTEKHEKAARRELREQTGCTEYEAAQVIAQRIQEH